MKERYVKCKAGGITYFIKEYKKHWWNRWKIEMEGNTPRIYFNEDL